MKKFIILTTFLVIVLATNTFAVKFTITGEAFKWVNFNPASGTRIYLDEQPDFKLVTEPLEGVKISLYYGSTFFQIDTTKPKLLEPVFYSDKDGKFIFKGKMDTTKTKRMAMTAEKEGYLGFVKTFNFDENKNEYKAIIYMVPKVNYKKK